MTNSATNGFVANGHQNACDAVAAVFRAQVTNEFQSRLAAANLVVRIWTLLEINREVRRRMAKLAPPDALY